jgi:acyl-coenzyme A synthetase/AMP-(fatty) acid ligase
VLSKPEFFNFAKDVIGHWASERPDALGLWCVNIRQGGEHRFTFRQLEEASGRAANFFRACGIHKGTRVLVLLPRIHQWWIGMLGLIRVGAVPVPTSLMLTKRELDYRLQIAQIDAAITIPEAVEKLRDYPGIRIIVDGSEPGWQAFDDGIASASPLFKEEPTRADDPGIIYFTSATTGNPKMVLHTQASYGLGHAVTGKLWLDLGPQDLHWNLSDVGWGKAAWSSLYGPWQAGACVFGPDTHGRFDPVQALNILANYPITTWCAPPTALRMVVREDLSRWKFPHLRHCVSAGEPLNPEILTQWKEATGLTIYEAYGQTETVVVIGNFRSQGHPVLPGSMGHAAPCFTVALLDDACQEVPDGTEGEIAIKIKPNRPLGLFKEYWKNPAETEAHFKGDWYLTGDRAVRDAHGYYWFIGRKDDVIKSSGYRIGPSEVENALFEHASVLDAAVVGKPDAVRGQIVKAFVVLRPGLTGSQTLKTQLQSHCKKVTAPYKYPREIEFVANLPKTTSGKTQRFELRKRA